jgi:hypothetical protein
MTLRSIATKAAVVFGFLATLAAFFFRARQKEAEADLAEDRVRASTNRADTLQAVSDNRNELDRRHNEEDIEDKASLARGDRDHLDGSW